MNADFDGDVLNQLAIEMKEIETFFRDFSPVNMIIDRVSSQIRLDVSSLENCSLAILSDI